MPCARSSAAAIRGVGSSELFALDPGTNVAGHRFKRSIGFDEDGNTVYSDGDILLETVHRFKGKAADAVVLVGVPRDIDSDTERDKVFVGVTRGRLALRVIQLPWHPLNVGRSDQPSR